MPPIPSPQSFIEAIKECEAIKDWKGNKRFKKQGAIEELLGMAEEL